MLNTRIKEFEGKLIEVINQSGLEPTIIELVLLKLQPEIRFAIEQSLKAEQEYMNKQQQQEVAEQAPQPADAGAVDIYPEDIQA